MSRPTHKVFLIPKEAKDGKVRAWTEVGVAWDTFADGTINVVLKPGTVLDYQLLKEFYLNIKLVEE